MIELPVVGGTIAFLADVLFVSVLRLGDGREITIPEALRRAMDEGSIECASAFAQVVDDEASPALLLIAAGDLVFVTRRRVKRWRPNEVKRVEGNEVQLRIGPAVTIGAWGAASERSDFLHAVTSLLQPREQTTPSSDTAVRERSAALNAGAASEEAELSPGAKIALVVCLIIALLGFASYWLLSALGNANGRS